MVSHGTKREITGRRETQKAIRTQMRKNLVRRVYTLENDLLVEVLDYQTERGLPSEVAAVRELLAKALMSSEF